MRQGGLIAAVTSREGLELPSFAIGARFLALFRRVGSRLANDVVGPVGGVACWL